MKFLCGFCKQSLLFFAILFCNNLAASTADDSLPNRFIAPGNYSDPEKWSKGSIPSIGEAIIIEFNCNVDLLMPIVSSITINSGAELSLNIFALPIISNIRNDGRINIQNILPFPIPAGVTYGGVVEYSSNLLQTIVNANYENLCISGSANKLIASPIAIYNTLDLLGGSLVIGSNVLTINGSINYGGGSLVGGLLSDLSVRGSGSILNLRDIELNNLILDRLEGIILEGMIFINGNLELSNGDIQLNGYTITLGPAATLLETAGNTVKGLMGAITTTRVINNPSFLNIGGLGIVINSPKNLGSTTVTRIHSPQSGNLSKGILRAFDIHPTNNFDLDASLILKYDESELNLITEANLTVFRSINLGINWTLRGGTININFNEVYVPVVEALSRWTLGDITNPLTTQELNLNVFVEGFYNLQTGQLNRDTMTVYLRNINVPYDIVDSSKAYLNTDGSGLFKFNNAVDETDYYLQLRHRNALETWSSTGQEFILSSLSYDFTMSRESAYGNNLKYVGNNWMIYGGDQNQDGFIDVSDLVDVYNDAAIYAFGYWPTEVTGDLFIDASDILVVYNNSINFVTEIRP